MSSMVRSRESGRVLCFSSSAVLICTLIGQQPAFAESAPSPAPLRVFDIPSQSLDASLVRIASEAGEPVSLDDALLQGKVAPAVRGQMSVESAMRQALAGSDLEVTHTPGGVLTVIATKNLSSDAKSAGPTTAIATTSVALPAVKVEATSLLGQSNEKDVQTFAGSRTLLDSKTLRTGAFRSLDDALQRVPGVRILDETGTGVLPQIMLRGLYESRSGRVQVLRDGIPLSLAPYGQTSLSLFPVTMNQIDRIDVVRGGAAMQYGPNNVGGVINLVSKPIPAKWTTTLGSKTTAAGSGHFLQDSSVSTGGYLNENFGLQLDADWLKGQYGRDHSNTDVTNIRLRTEWWLSEDKEITAEISRYVANMDLAGALSASDYARSTRQSTRPLDEFSGRTTRAAVSYLQDLGTWGIFSNAQFHWTNFVADSTRNFVVGMRRSPAETWRPDLAPQLLQSAPRTFHVYSTEPRFTFNIDTDTVTQQWTLGMRAMHENIDFIVENTGLDNGVHTLVRNWHFKDDALAGYVSDAIGLFNNRLTVTPGLRYEHLDSTYHDNVSGSNTTNAIRNFLPGLTIGYQFSQQWYGYADAQRSLRAPQVTQIIFGNNLDSELAWNYEAGVRFKPSNQLSLSAAVYRIDFKNQIELDNTSRAYGNLGQTRHQGIELQAEWQPFGLRNWMLNAGYTFLDAKLLSGQYQGNRVPFASPNQFNIGLTYSEGRNTFAVDGYYFGKSFSDKANTVAENSIGSVGQMPSYWVWNLKVSRVLMREGSSSLTGSLAINNLFNRQYWFRGIDTSPWGRQPAPGVTVAAGLEYTF